MIRSAFAGCLWICFSTAAAYEQYNSPSHEALASLLLMNNPSLPVVRSCSCPPRTLPVDMKHKDFFLRIAKNDGGRYRLVVKRSNNHMYGQVWEHYGSSDDAESGGCHCLASASTLEKAIRENEDVKNGGNKIAAREVGVLLGKRANEKGVEKVWFDRNGYNYHGRVAALADGAREAGLSF